MEVKFYANQGSRLWDRMKHQICENIIHRLDRQSTPKFYIRFDKMLYSIGWFVGYVEIWKGKKPYEKNRHKIPFTVKVWEWGSVNRNIPDYRAHPGDHGR